MAEKYVAYAEYKDSGVEWSETIPTHWKTASLSKLFMIKAGGDLQPTLFSETKTIEHQYPIYTNANDSKAVYGYTKKANFPSNTITVSGRGEVGFAVYRNHEFDAIIRLLVLIPFIKLDGRFFAYFINEVIDFNVQSSAIGQLSTLQISPYKVIIPPYEEQYLISDYLDYETAQIDTLIDKQQTLIQLLKEKRQAVISHAVTKGLNPDAPMKDSGVEWLGEVPEHWAIPQIGYHSKVTKLTGFEYTNLWRPNMEGKIIALRGFNIQERYLDLSKTERITEELSNKLARSKLYEGDIVLPCTGTLGNAALIQENNLYHINQNIAKVTINSELFNPEFTVFWMTSLPFRQMIDFNNTSGMQPVLLIGDIRKLPIPLLPLDEQQKIVDFLLLKTEQFDRLIDNAQQAIQLMQERRTALISAAVTGKIDVRDWQAAEQS